MLSQSRTDFLDRKGCFLFIKDQESGLDNWGFKIRTSNVNKETGEYSYVEIEDFCNMKTYLTEIDRLSGSPLKRLNEQKAIAGYDEKFLVFHKQEIQQLIEALELVKENGVDYY